MGVVSNGMLCSGDELRLTGDADGILILPADTPLGVPLADALRRRRPRRRRQAEPGRRPVDPRPRPRGRRRDPAQVRWPEPVVEEGSGPADRRTAGRRRPRPRPVHAVRRALGERRPGRPVAGRGPDAPARRGQRPISNVVDASQLRDARARQADPHVRRRRRRCRARRAAAIIVRRASPGERLETLDHVERELDAGDAAHRRPAGPARRSPGSWAAPRPRSPTPRRTSSSSRRSSTRSASAGPPSATRSARRRASASRRARRSAWPASAPTGRPS